MKSFVIKGTIFTVITAIIIQILNWSYMRTDPFDTVRFNNVPDGIQICNLGSSVGRYGFNYEDYDDEFITFNFAMDFQSAEYDYRILEQYKDRLIKDSVVFIPLALPILIGHQETEDVDFKGKNNRYYLFLDSRNIKEYSLITNIKLHYFPFVMASCLKEIIKGEDIWDRTLENQDVDTIKEDAIETVIMWENTMVTRNDKGDIIPFDEAIKAIYKIVKLCDSVGATPILIIPPITKELNQSMKNTSKQAYKVYYNTICDLCDKMDLNLYDYSNDERFLDRYDLFMDEFHLNKEGAREFTDIVISEIAKPYLNGYDTNNV